MTARIRASLRGQNSARRLRDPPRGASAAFATSQAKPAHEWILNVGIPLATGPRHPFFSAPLLPTRTHSCEPLVTDGAKFATPTPTRDGVTGS